jgi:hypothetical protein
VSDLTLFVADLGHEFAHDFLTGKVLNFAQCCAARAVVTFSHLFSLSIQRPTHTPAMKGTMNSIIKIVKVKNRST